MRRHAARGSTPGWTRRFGPWIALAFFGLAAWLTADRLRDVAWSDVGAAVAAYPPTTLASAVALVVASYLVYACYDLLARRHVGHDLTTSAVLGTALVSYAFNLNLGALVGGIGFRVRLYGKLGVDAARIGRVIGFSVIANWSGWLLLAGASFAGRQVQLSAASPIDAATLQVLGWAMIAVPLAYLATCFASRQREWHWRSHALVLPSGPLALAQLALSSVSWSLIGALVWLLLPAETSYVSVLATLLGAAIVGAITHVPGGLGVLEAVFLTALGPTFGASRVIAALLAFRALYYLAPLAVALPLHLLVEVKTRGRGRRAQERPSAS